MLFRATDPVNHLVEMTGSVLGTHQSAGQIPVWPVSFCASVEVPRGLLVLRLALLSKESAQVVRIVRDAIGQISLEREFG